MELYRKNDDTIQYKISRSGHLDKLKLEYSSYMYVVKEYYATSSRYVNRPNKLVSLLESLNIDFSKSASEVYDTLSSTARYSVADFGIVNMSRSNTNPIIDTFIDSSYSYVINLEEEFDFLNSDYASMVSLKCLYSNDRNIFITHPTEYNFGKDKIYCYSLNTVMLGMQYYYWVFDMMSKGSDTDPARFIFEVVLNNVIPSIASINFFNRVIASIKGEELEEFENDNPFYVKDLTSDSNKVIDWTVKNISKKTDLYYKELLLNIPTIIERDTLDVLALPTIFLTKKTKWFMYLTRMDYTYFILKYFDSKKERSFKQGLIKELKYVVNSKYLKADSVITNELLDSLVVKLSTV